MVNHGNVDGREGPLDDLEGFEPDIEEFEIPGEAYEDLESSDDSDERDAIRRFRFVKRFAAVPSVNFALFAASHLYSAFKEDYSTAGKVLDMVERCASLAYANLGQPVVDRLSTPLLVADLLACTALKKLELCCPEISKRPHEIIADVREFGQRKYDAIHAYVGEKVEAGRDFSECIATAAAHPVATARDCLRLAGDFAERQLGEAEAICEEHMLDVLTKVTPDNDPRGCVVPRLMRLSWKAYVCIAYHANLKRQRTADAAYETVSAIRRFFDELAEPFRQQTTLSGYAEVAFWHICRALVAPVERPADRLFDEVVTELHAAS